MNARMPNSFFPSRSSAALAVHLLGVVDFNAALLLQKHLVFEISGRKDRFGTLLLCEHPPLITMGREGSRGDLAADDDELQRRELEYRFVNRGGGTIVHGPGQLAVYPILPLQRLEVGLADYRSRLLGSIAATSRDLHIPCRESTKVAGLLGRCGQFAFLGAAVKSWISYHGAFVNVNPRLDLARLASAGGAGRITSLMAQRLRPVSMHAVRETVCRHLAGAFGYTQLHFHTGHPLLKRTTQRVCLHA